MTSWCKARFESALFLEDGSLVGPGSRIIPEKYRFNPCPSSTYSLFTIRLTPAPRKDGAVVGGIPLPPGKPGHDSLLGRIGGNAGSPLGAKKKGTNRMNEFTLDKFLARYGAVAQRSEPGEGIAPAVAGSNPARAARAHTLCP